jgi:hypothetical protein
MECDFLPRIQILLHEYFQMSVVHAHMGEGRGTYRILVGDLREGDYLEDPGEDGRIILKWIFKKWDGAWTGLTWLGIVTGGRLLSIR